MTEHFVICYDEQQTGYACDQIQAVFHSMPDVESWFDEHVESLLFDSPTEKVDEIMSYHRVEVWQGKKQVREITVEVHWDDPPHWFTDFTEKQVGLEAANSGE